MVLPRIDLAVKRGGRQTGSTCLPLLPCSCQVCQAATEHFTSQPNLSFLEGIEPPIEAAAEASSAGATQPGSEGQPQPSDWISQASSTDLVWLYFALYKHYHHDK